MKRFIVAATIAASAGSAIAEEVDIAMSAANNYRYTLETSTITATGAGWRTAIVFGYGKEGRVPIKVLANGCVTGFGELAYGTPTETYAQAEKVYWRRGGNRIFDAIATVLCAGRAEPV